VLLAAQILGKLDYVGVMGVELFVTPEGLVVNEIAPRVHNSGHWTQNGCTVDQFEQHIRAVAGWPLGDGRRHADVVMENLIGDDMDRVPQIARETNTALHLYGKSEVKPGRKMGHVNRGAKPVPGLTRDLPTNPKSPPQPGGAASQTTIPRGTTAQPGRKTRQTYRRRKTRPGPDPGSPGQSQIPAPTGRDRPPNDHPARHDSPAGPQNAPDIPQAQNPSRA
jgi:hypothetical protein